MLAETVLHHPLLQPRRAFEPKLVLPADVDDPGRRRRWSVPRRRRASAPPGSRHDAVTLGPAWQITALRTLYGA